MGSSSSITRHLHHHQLHSFVARGFRRAPRPWKGSASLEICPSLPTMTGLTILGTCPSLIHCQPLVAVTPKLYKPVMTGLTVLCTFPSASLIHCQYCQSLRPVWQYQPL